MEKIVARAETKTWNVVGGSVGVIFGALVAFGGILAMELGTMSLAYGLEASATAPLAAKIGIPIVLIIFGGAAGALIGNGIPRKKEHPDQGSGDAYHYMSRRARRRQRRYANAHP